MALRFSGSFFYIMIHDDIGINFNLSLLLYKDYLFNLLLLFSSYFLIIQQKETTHTASFKDLVKYT